MTLLDKKYSLTINLEDSTVSSPKGMFFFNTDKNVANLYVKIQYRDDVIKYLSKQEAINYKLTLTVIKPKSNNIKEIEGIITNDFEEDYAIYKFELPSEFTDQVGAVVCEFVVTNATEELTIKSFSYKIEESKVTGLNPEIIPNPDLPVLKQLIKDVKSAQQWITNIDDMKISEVKTYSSRKIEDIKTNIGKQLEAEVKKIDDKFNSIAYHITPEMFGAIGDGETDDLKAFNDMFTYMTVHAKEVSVGGNEMLKDFGGFNILFPKKYAVSDTVVLPSCYNLKIQGLYITCTNDFMSDFLMKSTGTFRNSHFNNCIFDGNYWKASCFLLESSSLMNRFDNCQFRRFKYYGFEGGINTGHELIFSNCKFNQYEWGDNDVNIMPLTKGVGLYLPEQRGDNQIINSVFCYCLDSAIKLYASCTLINNCHIYSRNGVGTYAVEIIGAYNILSNNYFDYTTLLLRGFNKIHNNMFISDVSTFNFIILDDTNENKWKYGTCQIIGNTFRSSTEKITSPIISKNFTINKGTMSIYDNAFDNCEVVYCEAHYNYNPSPFREFDQAVLPNGFTVVGDLKFMWGNCLCGDPVTLDCKEILNVQLTLYQETDIINEKAYASNVQGNTFTPNGEGYVYYFATCSK